MNKEDGLEIMEITNKTYDLIAEDFSDTRDRVWPEMEILVKRYVKPGDRVLDLGCGNGRLMNILPEVEYVGMDNSERLIANNNSKLKIQNSKLGNINFRVGDMLKLEQLELEGEFFNIVFMFAVLNHIPSEELRLKVLAEVKNLLKPGGYLLMTNWNLWRMGKGKSAWNYKIIKKLKQASIREKNELSFKDVMTRWRSSDGKRSGELYYRAFTLKELDRSLKQAGFQTAENYYSYDGKKVHWWRGKNIVTVGRKQATINNKQQTIVVNNK